jgi:hypothetical protein
MRNEPHGSMALVCILLWGASSLAVAEVSIPVPDDVPSGKWFG